MLRKRAIILGLAGGILLAAFTYFNDEIMRAPFLVGNFLPVSVFGTLLVFVLLINPLLGRISPSFTLSGRDLAVTVALALFVCFVPGRGLMHYFTSYIMLPNHHVRTTPAWQTESAFLRDSSVKDWSALERRLAGKGPHEELLAKIRSVFAAEELARLSPAGDRLAGDVPLKGLVIQRLNSVIQGDGTDLAFVRNPGLRLNRHVQSLLARNPASLGKRDLSHINRALIDAVFRDSLIPHRLGVIDRTPERMLADVSANPVMALDGYAGGLAKGDQSIRWSEVPWRAWIRALLFWVPLILTLCAMVIGLALVLHRQWSTHEHLPYPTVEFARSLLPNEDGSLNGVLKSRIFWIGCGAVLAIHVNNYACAWWPDHLIPITLSFDFSSFLDLMPVMKKGTYFGIFVPTLYFTALAFAYFLATDVSLSLGLAPIVYGLATGLLASYGISCSITMQKVNLPSALFAGAYFGMFAVLLHAGRQYYKSVFRQCLFLSSDDTVEPAALWGSRLFLLGMALAVFQLMTVGVDWPMAVLYLIGMLVIFTVMSRLLAEAGVFFLQACFYPCVVIWGFMGAEAAGINQLLTLSIVSGLLLIETRETMMPFFMSGICLVDRLKVKIGRTSFWGGVALVLGLLTALPIVLRIQYQRGVFNASEWWNTNYIPRLPYNVNSELAGKLDSQGLLDASIASSGWHHFVNLSPDMVFVTGFLATFGLVLLFSFLRYRFAWWPLHPLLFLVIGSWQTCALAFSFLLGCGIKVAVTQYGGTRLYHRLKPLMLGLIAGEMLASLVPVVIGAVYYLVNGTPPKSFLVMPG